jgi:hypothetical protein
VSVVRAFNAVAGVLTGLTSGPRYGLLDDHVLGITLGTEAEVQPYWDRYISALQLQNRRMFRDGLDPAPKAFSMRLQDELPGFPHRSRVRRRSEI